MKKCGVSSRNIGALPLSSYVEELRGAFSPMKRIATGVSPVLPEEVLPIKAVLFDIYGTLLISEAGDIGLSSAKRADPSPARLYRRGEPDLRPYGEIREALFQLIRRSHADSMKRDASVTYPEVDILAIWDELFARLSSRAYTPEDLVRSALAFELQTNKVWLMPGAEALLSTLKARGVPCGIVSNAQFYTPLFLNHLLGAPLGDLGFSEELISWSFAIGRGKPDDLIFSAPLEELERRQGILPSEVLYVGNDMLNDIYTARRRGMKTALFAGDKRSLRLRKGDARTTGLEADCIITDLAQIPSVIGKEQP